MVQTLPDLGLLPTLEAEWFLSPTLGPEEKGSHSQSYFLHSLHHLP